MARGDINLLRLALFEVKKEKDEDAVADLIGKKVFNLQKPIPEHLQLIAVLERNIKKRIISLESKDASKKLTSSSAIERFDDLELRGAPSKAIILELTDEAQKSQLKELLDSKTDQEFRQLCAPLTNLFAETTKYPKGIIGFVQFDFQISRGAPKRFLSILITDFSLDILTVDTLKVLKYLERTFKHNFRTTMIYPHIVDSPIISNKEGVKTSYVKDIDKQTIKIHSTTEDPAVYRMVGTEPPRNPQKEVEKVYRNKASELSNIGEVKKFLKDNDMKSASVKITIDDNTKLFVDLGTFIDKYQLFVSNKGKGFLVKGGEIEVFLGNKNLLNEQKINFKSLEEIYKDDNSE